jgi:hypothetical protein
MPAIGYSYTLWERVAINGGLLKAPEARYDPEFVRPEAIFA